MKRFLLICFFVSSFILHPSSLQSGSQPRPSAGLPYKVYTATLYQSGTSAPAVTVLQNTLGGEVVWTRADQGIYQASLSGAFTTSKTAVFCSADPTAVKTDGLHVTSYDSQNNSSTDVIQIVSWRTTDLDRSDDLMHNDFIEIRVYP